MRKILTDAQKDIIIKNYENKVSPTTVANILGIPKSTITSFWSRYQHVKGLPPKIKTSKSMINGKMGLEIKKIIKEKPTISIRKVEGILKSGLFNDKPIPTRSTIHKFLKDNQLEKSTLLQKVPFSDVNKIKVSR